MEQAAKTARSISARQAKCIHRLGIGIKTYVIVRMGNTVSYGILPATQRKHMLLFDDGQTVSAEMEPDQILQNARDRIARACWRLVATQGIAAVSMRHIATEMSLTTGFLTRYFKDKQSLLSYALATASDTLARKVEAVTGHHGQAQIHAMAQALLPHDETARLAWHFWLAMGGMQVADPELAAMHQIFPDRLRRALVAAMRQVQQTGQLPPECYVAGEADLLIAGLLGLCSQAIAAPARFGEAKCQALLTGLILRIGAPSTPMESR